MFLPISYSVHDHGTKGKQDNLFEYMDAVPVETERVVTLCHIVQCYLQNRICNEASKHEKRNLK